MIDLTESQIERYSRHILLQMSAWRVEKILNAKVLIIGAGGLEPLPPCISLLPVWERSALSTAMSWI